MHKNDLRVIVPWEMGSCFLDDSTQVSGSYLPKSAISGLGNSVQ